MRRPTSAGFTLVELMISVAMIAILAGVAISYSGESRANLKAFSVDLVGEADSARLRAIASRRWNRMRFDVNARKVILDQSTVIGMVPPQDNQWQQVSTITIPRTVLLVSITTTSDIGAGNTPTDGVGINEVIRFAPDGSGVARTIYLKSKDLRVRTRVIVYRATGTAFAKVGW